MVVCIWIADRIDNLILIMKMANGMLNQLVDNPPAYSLLLIINNSGQQIVNNFKKSTML